MTAQTTPLEAEARLATGLTTPATARGTLAEHLDALDYAVEGLDQVLGRTASRLAPILVPSDESAGKVIGPSLEGESLVAEAVINATVRLASLTATLDALTNRVQL